MAHISTHVAYNGNCEEAFLFYKSIFGGEFNNLMRNQDSPPNVPAPPGSVPSQILHISLPLSNGCALMGCDMPPAYGVATSGNRFNISISTGSEAETEHIYSGLLAGGKIAMPLENTFWGAYFGMVVDKYDVQWMVTYDAPTV